MLHLALYTHFGKSFYQMLDVGCWILSNAYSAPIERIMWLLTFVNVVYTLICIFRTILMNLGWIPLGHGMWFFFFFVFFGLHSKHMLGVKLEPQQLQIQAVSVTYTTAQGNARSLTHQVRPGIEPVPSWILAKFAIAEPWWELLVYDLFFFFLMCC